MRRRPWWRLVVYPLVALALMAGTCDVTRDATPTSSTVVPTTPLMTSTTTVVIAEATTTTTSPSDEPPTRVDELAVIGAELNVERLAAIHDLDLERVRGVDGTDTLFDQDAVLIGSGGWEWVAAPTLDNVPYGVDEIFLDRPDCAVVSTFIDLRDVLGFDEAEEQIEVFFFDADGNPSLANILRLTATSTSWEMICDEAERTAGAPIP